MKIPSFLPLLLATFLLAPSLSAATFTVNTLDDENGTGPNLSLREAISASSSGDTIEFASGLNGRSIQLIHGSLNIQNVSLMIDASMLPLGITVSGGGLSRVFSIDQQTGHANVNLERIAVRDGQETNTIAGGLCISANPFNSASLTVNMTDCRIENNHSLAFAGGIYLSQNASLNLTRCSLIGNTASGNGGAIHSSGLLTATQCTIACNRGLKGAAIYIQDTPHTLSHCTVTQNIANLNDGGAIFLLGAGPLNLTHTIVAANSSSNIETSDPTRITSLGYNLIGDTTPAPAYGTATDIFDNEPGLLEPMMRGGVTKTCAFRPNSPACNAGDPALTLPLTDQRGFSRFRNGIGGLFTSATIDIGAFELGETVMVTTTVDEFFTLPDNGTSLREALDIAATTGNGTRVAFSPAIFSGSEFSLASGELTPTSSVWIDGFNDFNKRPIKSAGSTSRIFDMSGNHTVTLDYLTLAGGNSTDGGGLRVAAGSRVNLVDSEVTFCSARRGAGIFSEGDLFLSRSLVSNCQAEESSPGAQDASGAAIFTDGKLNAENSIFFYNNSDGISGGIHSGGDCLLTHCTISGNQSFNGGSGGGLAQTSGHAELRYSVFTNNIAGFPSENFSGVIISGAINAEDGVQLTGPNDLVGINPHFVGFGVTPDEFLSPLIDRGETISCSGTDWLGSPRIRKGSANTTPAAPARADLGAIESRKTFYVTTNADQNSGDSSDGLSLREAIDLTNASTDESGSVITFDPDLCGSRIQLLAAMGGSLEITNDVIIRGPSESSASIEINGTYIDPHAPVTAADFSIFNLSGKANHKAQIDLRSLTIKDGATLADGGGIAAVDYVIDLSLTNILVAGCRATNGGGLMIEGVTARAKIDRCTFYGNTASDDGGAISATQNSNGFTASIEIDRSTFVENRADRGGAVRLDSTGSFDGAEVTHSTFTNNRATSLGGAALLDGSGSLAKSIATGNFPQDVAGTSAQFSNNILGNDPSSNPSNLVTSDAKLGTYGDHGGATPTVPLLFNSPAIDFVSASAQPDQRGVAEVDGDGDLTILADAGAYEFHPLSVIVNTIDDENGLPNDPNTSLREALGLVGPGGVISFDPLLNGQTLLLTSPLEIAADQLVTIDASHLPSGLTISGGGTLDTLVRNHGYAQFKGLVFRDSLKEAIRTAGFSFSHIRVDGCHFDSCGGPVTSNNLFSGALNVGECATAELFNSSFFNNRGSASGVFFNAGRLTANQCIFSSNTGKNGGVLHNFLNGIANFSHCTFLENSATPTVNAPGAGKGEIGYNTEAIETSFHACLFDENTSDPLLVSNPPAPNSFRSLGGNISRSNEPLLNHSTDLIGIDPKLGPEKTHRIIHYHAPEPHSPAIDTIADPFPATDIRGLSRPLDGDGDFVPLTDSGAVEAPPMILVDISHDENDGIGNGAGTSLRDAVNHLNNNSFAINPAIGFAPFLSGQQITVQSFLGGEIVISKETTIDASNLTHNPIITGEGTSGNFRIFQINASGETIHLRCLNITEGGISSLGAGILVTNATTAELTDCEISNNLASGDGGGIAVTQGSELNMERCTLAENQADGFGGGLFVSNATAILEQCTVSDNFARTGGGAISDLLPSDIDLRHCTIADNMADSGAGGIDLAQASARASHTILARNLPFNFNNRSGFGALTSLGYNMDDGTTGSFGQASDIPDLSIIELGSLQFLGGRVRVMPPFLCSLAIDSGDPSIVGAPAFDQTGLTPRLLDGDYNGSAIIDRGAVELDVYAIDQDLDNDQIPNQWEVLNNYNPKDPSDATQDNDGDGRNTHAEYVAGTLPNDPASFFQMVRMDDIFSDQTTFEIEWTSNDLLPDIVYDVSSSTDMINWTPVLTDLTATPSSPTTSVTVVVSQTPAKSNYFIRVAARRVPLL